MGESSTVMDRRTVLASAATGASLASAGCLSRLRSLTGWQSPDPVGIQIKTYPNDADPYALSIAGRVSDWLREAGIDAEVAPVSREALHRDVLLNDDFDAFVARSPGWFRTPDSLYGLLHSRYTTTPGWHNPFGYTNLSADEHLEVQRTATGTDRTEAIADLQRTVAETQPFSIIGFPDDIRTANEVRYGGWTEADLRTPRNYVGVDRTADKDTLRLVTTDSRPTQNLNPIAVEFRPTPDPVDLLYDSLGVSPGGERVDPLLASDWTFARRNPDPVARVQLREDLRWHDGESLTAADVAFTHEFLANTALGENDGDPIPAPRYRGMNALVESVDVIDHRSVEFSFVECDPRVAAGAFTVPILPKHVWSDRTGASSVGGIDIGGGTEALVTNNVPAIGSGPLEFADRERGESLTLEPFDEYVGFREGVSLPGSPSDGDPAFDQFVFRTVGSDVTAVNVVGNGEMDVTWDPVGADNVSRIVRNSDLDLFADRSHTYYLLGYNTRRQPFTNPRFRQVIAGLIDKGHLSETVFGGYLDPAASPLAGTEWLPSDLQWDEEDPVTPFIGSDGEVAAARARDRFREIGYRYDDDKLVEG